MSGHRERHHLGQKVGGPLLESGVPPEEEAGEGRRIN